MLSRCMLLFAVLGLVAVPGQVRADEKTAPPTLQVRLKSLDRVLDDLKYFLSLAGQKDAIGQLDELQKQLLPPAYPGIDTSKPWALYGRLNPNVTESSSVLFVPVITEKGFLSYLENVAKMKAAKEGEYYLLQRENVPFPVYLRFMEGYACIGGPDKGALANGTIISPKAMFAKPISGGAEFHFRIDQVPNEYKQMILGSVEVQMANQADLKIPGENEATRRGRLLGAKTAGQLFNAVLKDGTDISLDLNISREKDKLGIGFGVSGAPGSEMGKRIASLTAAESLFASWIKPTSPINFVAHAPLGDGAQKIVELLFEEGFAAMAKQGEKQKELSEKIKKALTPTIQAHAVDVGFDLRGPTSAGHYTLLAGMRVADGDKIEALIKDLVREAPEVDRAKIKFDASSIGEFKVHKLDVASSFDKDARAMWGDNPIYFTFRKDAILLVLGESGLATLGEAISTSPGTSPLAMGRINVKGLVPLMKNEPRAAPLAKSTFVNEGDDAITFRIQGGESLQLYLEARGPVIKFLAGIGNKK
jgi:hypothetical protein